MKRKILLLFGLQMIRLTVTALMLRAVAAPVFAAGFTLLTVPFSFALAYDLPRLALAILIAYAAVFLLSHVFLFFSKTREIGIVGAAVTLFADLCAFVASGIVGANRFYLVGVPVCLLGLLLCAACLNEHFRQRHDAAQNDAETEEEAKK